MRVGVLGRGDGLPRGVGPAGEGPLLGLEDALLSDAEWSGRGRGGGGGGVRAREEGGGLCGDEGELVAELESAGVVVCEAVVVVGRECQCVSARGRERETGEASGRTRMRGSHGTRRSGSGQPSSRRGKPAGACECPVRPCVQGNPVRGRGESEKRGGAPPPDNLRLVKSRSDGRHHGRSTQRTPPCCPRLARQCTPATGHRPFLPRTRRRHRLRQEASRPLLLVVPS